MFHNQESLHNIFQDVLYRRKHKSVLWVGQKSRSDRDWKERDPPNRGCRGLGWVQSFEESFEERRLRVTKSPFWVTLSKPHTGIARQGTKPVMDYSSCDQRQKRGGQQLVAWIRKETEYEKWPDQQSGIGGPAPIEIKSDGKNRQYCHRDRYQIPPSSLLIQIHITGKDATPALVYDS